MIDFNQPSPVVARELIGVVFLLRGVGGVIVETEAYDETEEASHAYRGPTLRNAALYGCPGTAYIYRSYGIHWCLNIVCREVGHAAGVLLRALEPTTGIPTMIERRGTSSLLELCSGPGKLGQALAISEELSGARIRVAPFKLIESAARRSITTGARIGISKAKNRQWRFGLRGSGYISQSF